MPIQPSTDVALISANANHVAQDKAVLKRMALRSVTIFDNVQRAVAHMAESPASIVLLDSELNGDDPRACLRSMRRLRSGASARASIPVVMVTLENSREFVLDAIGAGCAGYVIRPYSPATMEKYLEVAYASHERDEIESEQMLEARNMVDQGLFDEAIDEYEEVLCVRDEAEEYFAKGMEYLRNVQYGKAIIAFNKAIKLNEMFAEAYRGLADAHRGKGNDDKARQCMGKAAEIFAMQDRLEEARELFVDILKDDPDAMNPYNTLGVRLRKQGDYPGALHAYKQALELTPDDENLRYNIAKAFLFAEDTNHAVEHLRAALEVAPDFAEARALLEKLTGTRTKPPTTAKRDERPSDKRLLIDDE